MNPEHTTPALADLNQKVRDAWNQNAAFWDEKMGEGNLFQKVLVGPSSERLLELQPGELVLEIACGNGVFTRRMAELGVHVIATDFSEQLLELAQKRSTAYADLIEYRRVDATDEAQMLALGERRFDAVVCNMAMMDMATIEPLMTALSRLLKTDGRFVFSIMHPCFNSGSTFSLEEEDREGEIIAVYAVKISKYLGLSPQKGLGIIGQPTPHYYFYRPLHVLFNTCFRAGFVLDALEEPAFRPEDQGKGSRWFGWASFTEIPPVLVARLRLRR